MLTENTMVLQEQSKPYDAKADCWVPDPVEGYAAAKIVSTKGDLVTITTKGSGTEVRDALFFFTTKVSKFCIYRVQ
jgi:hypothetical protein